MPIGNGTVFASRGWQYTSHLCTAHYVRSPHLAPRSTPVDPGHYELITRIILDRDSELRDAPPSNETNWMTMEGKIRVYMRYQTELDMYGITLPDFINTVDNAISHVAEYINIRCRPRSIFKEAQRSDRRAGDDE